MTSPFLPDVLDIWRVPVTEDQEFRFQIPSQIIRGLPLYYHESKVLRILWNIIGKELEYLHILMEPYHFNEIDNIKNNVNGWDFEKIFAQINHRTANHLLSRITDILGITIANEAYIDSRRRANVTLSHHRTNTPQNLVELIEELIDDDDFEISVLEDFANYVLDIFTKGVNVVHEPVLIKAICNLRPYHIYTRIHFYEWAIDDGKTIDDGLEIGTSHLCID